MTPTKYVCISLSWNYPYLLDVVLGSVWSGWACQVGRAGFPSPPPPSVRPISNVGRNRGFRTCWIVRMTGGLSSLTSFDPLIYQASTARSDPSADRSDRSQIDANISNLVVNNYNISDHFPVFMIKKRQKIPHERGYVYGRSYKYYDKIDYQNNLQNLDWSILYLITLTILGTCNTKRCYLKPTTCVLRKDLYSNYYLY